MLLLLTTFQTVMVLYVYGQHCRFANADAVLLHDVYENASKAV